ncbi:hypothetical protein FRB90_009601, partial [Tulasnella sp. 427]
IHRRESRKEEALSTLEEAVAIASRSGDKLGEAKALVILGATHMTDDDYTQALAILQESLDKARRIGWESGVCTALWDIGTIKTRTGDYPEAERLLQESVAMARKIKLPWRVGQVLGALGLCLARQDRLDEAIKVREESYAAYEEISLFGESALAARTVGDLKRQKGSRREALRWYDLAAGHYRKAGETFGISECMYGKAQVFKDAEEYDEAALHFEVAMVLDMQINFHNAVVQDMQMIATLPKTVIKWESRKYTTLRQAANLCALPLPVDLKKLQRRVPQLRSPGLNVRIAVGGAGDR